jgi:hypothetical protein
VILCRAIALIAGGTMAVDGRRFKAVDVLPIFIHAEPEPLGD